MVPVDLNHRDRLERALSVSSELAKMWDVPIHYVAIAPATPGPLGHTPTEFAHTLEDFARSEAERRGHRAMSSALTSHDPATDLDRTLADAVDEIGADLVVMQSHVPGLAEHLWPSHGGRLARHTKASVFLVR